jgi:hypothetical protein
VTEYRLFTEFRGLFQGKKYEHRRSNLGDFVAMQIDRVKSDLAHQVQNFKRKAGSSHPICVAVVGTNFAEVTTSYEGDRSYRTDGRTYKHPIQEAEQASNRLASVAEKYDEFLILRYRAKNEPPYSFEWVNQKDTSLEYGAALIRISNEYQKRF